MKISPNINNLVKGQDRHTAKIMPYIKMYNASLQDTSRPVGVFMLAGPTGVGKTRTVESLAKLIHGDEKRVLKINCGEFQLEHEISRLIGAPPGFIGHRETTPVLSKANLSKARSDRSSLVFILFDEIEKAASSLLRILLGSLDKGKIDLGDNTAVDLTQTMIFFTSNLGNESRRIPGIQNKEPEIKTNDAIRKHFSPEFLNRIDEILIYDALTKDSIREILELEIQEICNNRHRIHLTDEAKDFIIERGFSEKFGARELKRTITRSIIIPMIDVIPVERKLNSVVKVSYENNSMSFEYLKGKAANL